MRTETYDDLEWQIEEFPVGFSTPDELFEYWFRASATCENGHSIRGTAYYWNHYDDGGSGGRLNRVEYTPCEECMSEGDDLYGEDLGNEEELEETKTETNGK